MLGSSVTAESETSQPAAEKSCYRQVRSWSARKSKPSRKRDQLKSSRTPDGTSHGLQKIRKRWDRSEEVPHERSFPGRRERVFWHLNFGRVRRGLPPLEDFEVDLTVYNTLNPPLEKIYSFISLFLFFVTPSIYSQIILKQDSDQHHADYRRAHVSFGGRSEYDEDDEHEDLDPSDGQCVINEDMSTGSKPFGSDLSRPRNPLEVDLLYCSDENSALSNTEGPQRESDKIKINEENTTFASDRSVPASERLNHSSQWTAADSRGGDSTAVSRHHEFDDNHPDDQTTDGFFCNLSIDTLAHLNQSKFGEFDSDQEHNCSDGPAHRIPFEEPTVLYSVSNLILPARFFLCFRWHICRCTRKRTDRY